MDPKITIITLGVKDLNRSYEFYKNGLGFPTTRTPEKGIIFFQTQGVCLALYPYEELAKDVGDEFNVERSKFPGVTLAYNAKSKEEVDEIVETAVKAGAKLEKKPQKVFWGGYSGYFSDPDGYLWEVAEAGFEFNEDGSIIVT